MAHWSPSKPATYLAQLSIFWKLCLVVDNFKSVQVLPKYSDQITAMLCRACKDPYNKLNIQVRSLEPTKFTAVRKNPASSADQHEKPAAELDFSLCLLYP